MTHAGQPSAAGSLWARLEVRLHGHHWDVVMPYKRFQLGNASPTRPTLLILMGHMSTIVGFECVLL